jgi:formamidopyrimidine-DNA glycosylase
MAELPDLSVFAAILTRRFKGKTLEELDVTVSKKLNVSVEALKSALEGRELTAVKREGKTLQFHFSGDQILGMHLMLRGELVSLEGDETPKFQIMAFHFKMAGGFALVDMQKIATPTLQPQAVKAPDALNLDKAAFKALLAKKRTVIKTLLMDQQVMRGIGNTYADEILHHADISPFSTANAIPAKAADKLYSSIKTVLEKAIQDIGEANGDELKGELRDFLEVHNPNLKTTSIGEVIKHEKIGGRTTYYTDSQELF